MRIAFKTKARMVMTFFTDVVLLDTVPYNGL